MCNEETYCCFADGFSPDCLIVSAAAFAESELEQLAIEYLELSGTRQTFHVTIAAYADQAVASQSGIDKEEITRMLEALMGWEVLKEPTAKIIMNHFTADQLEQINAFYRSDVGRAYAQKSPAIAIDVSNLVSGNVQRSVGQPQP